jgi:two-component system, NarL family, sensor histidine kinase UhpB
MTVDSPRSSAVPSPRSAGRRLRMTLYRRVFASYAALITLALLVLIFAPVTISVPVTRAQLVGLLVGFGVMLAAFHVLLHRGLAPLERLTALMRRVDPLRPGRRLAVEGSLREVVELTDAFNAMLDRLESERRDSARRALAAQEDERRRIARELHDEIGQVLTGLVLRSDTLARRMPDAARGDLEDLREAARQAAEEVRRIAVRLRPEALDQLGLQSALLALFTATTDRTGLRIERDLERELPLNAEQELVIYRVAQESLTNVARHARATHAHVALRRDAEGGVVLVVRDDGAGIPAGAGDDSNGLRGMRERALLVGADLAIGPAPGGGAELRLRLPPEEVG